MNGEVEIAVSANTSEEIAAELRRMADELAGGASEADWYVAGNGESQPDVQLHFSVENDPEWTGGAVAEIRRRED